MGMVKTSSVCMCTDTARSGAVEFRLDCTSLGIGAKAGLEVGSR